MQEMHFCLCEGAVIAIKVLAGVGHWVACTLLPQTKVQHGTTNNVKI